MEGMFQSLLERTTEVSKTFQKLFNGPPAIFSSSSSSSCSQIVEDLENLRRGIERIRFLLTDAERRELWDMRIRLWLRELKDVAYESEDVLEEMEYELLRYQLACEKEELAPITLAPITQRRRGIDWKSKVREPPMTPRCTTFFDASFQQQIVAKIKGMNDLFEGLYGDGCCLALYEGDGRRHMAGLLQTPAMASSRLDDELRIWGREDYKVAVMQRLLSDVDDESKCNENVRAVSILGMGGLGKTTLAELIFQDDVVVNHFDTRLWVCVSEPFEVSRLTREILGNLQGRSSEVQEFDSLRESLLRELQGKRFLLVLDDVWNENQGGWEKLWVCLLSGAGGSRVLITTRSQKVTRVCGVSRRNMFHLKCLSMDDSWALFKQRAFSGRNISDHPNLVPIGQQIVKRCKGLPLAVKTLAGLLFCEFSEDRWMSVLYSELWDLSDEENHIIPALTVSYGGLPSPMKQCFAYFALFPKDQEFESDEMVLLWMAQGYVKPTKTKPMEEMGREYLRHLEQRSFLEYCGGDRFKMHDLIHDLAQSVSGGACLRVEVKELYGNPPQARHLWFEGKAAEAAKLLSCGWTGNLQPVRSFYMNNQSRHALSSNVLDGMFQHMKCLRVLDLRTVKISELPDSVGELKHLRYLRISGANLLGLPESLGNLLYLQTLEIKGARCLEEVLKCLEKLVNLRYLILHRF